MFSIKHKISGLLLITIAMPILTSILITYNFTEDSVTKEVIQHNSKLLSLGKTEVEDYLTGIDQGAFTTLYHGGSDNLFELIRRGESGLAQRQQINSSLEQLGNMKKEYFQVSLSSDNQNQTYLYRNYNFEIKKNAEPAPDNQPLVYIVPTHMSDANGINNSEQNRGYHPNQVFTYRRIIQDVPLPDRLGVLALDVKLDYLQFISSKLYTKELNEEIIILNEENQVIFASDPNLIGRKFRESWTGELASPKEAGYFSLNDNSFHGLILFDSITLPFANWKLVKKVPINLLNQDAKHVTKINTFILISFMVLAVGASLIIVNYNFINPIKELINEMEVVEKGGFFKKFPKLKRNDEFGILFGRFYKMVQRLNDLILREYRMEIANKTNQLRALQAQINPHFLNNALQSIGTLALKGLHMNVYSLTTAIGQMMHYNMDLDESIVPITSEIEYIASYLKIQQERFEGLAVVMNVDESILNAKIPKMTLQPIVENYFIHGIVTNKDIGTIGISIEPLDEQFMLIKVEDNGIGMEPDQLAILTNELNRQGNPSNRLAGHVGLINVMARLRLFYGQEIRIDISNVIPHGLKVMFRIPILTGGGSDHESINRG